MTASDRDAIRTEGLTRRFGATVALDGLDLRVPRGSVFGYLGPNGAGKTTTIRLLLGLIAPTAGSATVLGRDVAHDRDAVHAGIGYLPGDFVAYAHRTPAQYLSYLAALRGGVDDALLDALVERFHLPMDRRIRELSHGNRQKVGIVQAFMHRPDLLLLDEPTAGLDPLMQREFQALVRETRDDGRTVLLSSHILDEVEAIADRVAILRGGRLVVVEQVQALKQRAVRRVDLTFDGPVPVDALEAATGVTSVSMDDGTAHIVVEGSMADLMAAAAPARIHSVVTHEADLEEIFLTYYRDGAHA